MTQRSAGAGRSRRQLLFALVLGVVVLAVAITLTVVSLGNSAHHDTNQARAWHTDTFGGLTLRYPVGWHAAPVSFNPLGGHAPVAYISDRASIARCKANGTCQRPTRMTADETLLEISEGETDPNLRPTTLIGGWPAAVHTGACGRDARYGRSVTLFVGPQTLNPQTIEVAGCTASADLADRQVIDRIAGGLRYVGLVRISGRFHVIGGPPPGIDEPLSGRITLQPDDGGLAITLSAVDGRYAGTVPPGPYTITGTSPRIGSGRALCSGALDPVMIRRRPVHANVVCDIN